MRRHFVKLEGLYAEKGYLTRSTNYDIISVLYLRCSFRLKPTLKETDMMKNILQKNMLCILICVMLLAVVSFSACNSKADDEDTFGDGDESSTIEQIPMLESKHQLNENGLVDVVVLKENIKKGQKIKMSNLKIVECSPENLPVNLITDRALVNGKYALCDLYEGDYIISEWLVDDKAEIPYAHLLKKDIESVEDDYIIVTDFVKANTGEDLCVPLQELIDKNPGRTLYFPDGEYVISRSLLTTSEPSESTSFHFSSSAVLKAADYWESGGSHSALIRLGAYKKVNNINMPGSNFFVMGGIFDCGGIADGIAIDAGRETLIKDVVIVNSHYGIYVTQGTNGASSDTDIDDVTVIGNGKFNSVGVCFAGDDNTITNARISNVGTGMTLSNHTFVAACTVENTTGLKNSTGFLVSGNVHLSDCVSINFDTAFNLGSSSKGCVKQCTALWTTNESEKHTAFSVGRLQLLMLGCRAEFVDGNCENIFLDAIEDGSGGVVAPSFDVSLVSDNDMTEYYLEDETSILDMLP